MMTYIHTKSMKEHCDIEIGHNFLVLDPNHAKGEITVSDGRINNTTYLRTLMLQESKVFYR